MSVPPFDALDMKRRAEQAARDRRLKMMQHGADPDIDTAVIVAQARAREAATPRPVRAAGWKLRQFRAWLRTVGKQQEPR